MSTNTVEYQAILLDRNLNVVRELTEFIRGHMENNYNRPLMQGAILEMGHSGIRTDLDILNDSVRLFARYIPEGSSTPVTQVIGTLRISVPEYYEDPTNDYVITAMQCFDQLIVVEQDGFGEPYRAPAGVPITQLVRDILRSCGIPDSRILVEESSDSLEVPVRYSAEYSKRQIINMLLSNIGYQRLMTDAWGNFIVRPTTDPFANPRRLSLTWEQARPRNPDGSRFTPQQANELVMTSTAFEAVNFLALHGEHPSGESSFHLWVENRDPLSPYSIPRRGRRITHTEIGLEVASVEGLLGIARARLFYNLVPVYNAFMDVNPQALLVRGPIQILDSVTMHTPQMGSTDITGVIHSWTLELANSSLVELRVRLLPFQPPVFTITRAVTHVPGIPVGSNPPWAPAILNSPWPQYNVKDSHLSTNATYSQVSKYAWEVMSNQVDRDTLLSQISWDSTDNCYRLLPTVAETLSDGSANPDYPEVVYEDFTTVPQDCLPAPATPGQEEYFIVIETFLNPDGTPLGYAVSEVEEHPQPSPASPELTAGTWPAYSLSDPGVSEFSPCAHLSQYAWEVVSGNTDQATLKAAIAWDATNKVYHLVPPSGSSLAVQSETLSASTDFSAPGPDGNSGRALTVVETFLDSANNPLGWAVAPAVPYPSNLVGVAVVGVDYVG